MKKFGLAIVAIVIMISGVGIAHAQDRVSPESAALVKELVVVTGGKQQFNDVEAGMMSFQSQQMKESMKELFKDDKDLTAADKASIAQITEESMTRIEARSKEFFTNKFDFDKFVNDVYVPVYTKHFTDNELREMIAFYRTPTGQKMSKETPALMADALAGVSTNLIPAFSEYIKQAIDEETASIKQRLSKK